VGIRVLRRMMSLMCRPGVRANESHDCYRPKADCGRAREKWREHRSLWHLALHDLGCSSVNDLGLRSTVF
jgi:hypothetical protein